jgi:hypothetical protein
MCILNIQVGVMANKFSEFVAKAKAAISRVAADPKTKEAIEKTKDAAITSATEAGKAGKGFLKTEMGKSMAAPAILGALIAIPLPIIGPILGALIGAAYGYYKYSNRPASPIGVNAGNESMSGSAEKVDVYAELAKLDVLRRSGTPSEEEFNDAKSQLLKRK